jgi:hypothetical protein
MTKSETQEAIKKAKEAHELQMQKIEAAINGKEIDNPTAINKTECDFGNWLYDDKDNIQEIIGTQFFKTLDIEHEKWHVEYTKIYHILFSGNNKKGLLSRLLGKKSIDPMELDKVKLYYRDLQETTSRLLKILASSERRISALPESKFH